MRYLYALKLLLKCNLPLGVWHFIRRKIHKKNVVYEQPTKIIDIFSLKKRNAEIENHLKQNIQLKDSLFLIADNFVDAKVSIYQKSILLTNYTIDKFHANILKKEIFQKDIRFHWEIYRCKYLFNVGLVYYLTKKKVYSESLINFIKNWGEFSPIVDDSLPYNGMEAAIKLINLSWLDIFLADSPDYTGEIRNCLISSIIIHAEYVYKNYDITFYGLESNHGLSCAVGLIYASLLFPEYKNSKKWYHFGMRALKRALRNQFSEDGVNFESSVQYHRFVFELLIFLLAALYKNKENVDVFVEDSIKNIGCALKVLTHKNSLISKIGDSDGGKFLYDLGSIEEFNSLNYLNWFIKDNKGRYYETLLFENISELRHFISEDSNRHKVGKYLSYKDSDISLIISANEIGTLGKGNHQHNDFLSFELYSDCPFIIDPWSYCYTGDKDLRNNDRKTRSHNTIEIDGRDIVEFNPDRLFEMLGNIDVNIEKVVDRKNTTTFELSHNGYKNLAKGPQMHTRKFTYDKKNSTLKISDNLSGEGKHTARYYLHIHKEYWDLEVGNNELIFFNDKERFILRSNLGKFNVEECFVSENYLTHVQTYRICLEQEYENNLNIELVVGYEKRSG